MKSLAHENETRNPESVAPAQYPNLRDLLLPASVWHWLAYLICLVILVWTGAQAGPICFLEGDDLNIALGVKLAVQGVQPLQWSYRFATAAGLYYPLYFLASLGMDPLTAYYLWSHVCAYLFVLAFSLFAARLLGVHLSLCLLALLSMQEVIASFLYANDMTIGLLLVSCGLAVQVFRPRFWLPLTVFCAALAIWVRIDMAQAVLLNLILVHAADRSAADVRKSLFIDLVLGTSVVLMCLALMLAGGAEMFQAFVFSASHVSYFLSDTSATHYVNTQTLHSLLGPWLAPACLGAFWLAWDRRLIPCLMVGAFCLAGVLLILPMATTPKYLLPHLTVASLGTAYALGRLLSGRAAARLLGTFLACACLLFPLVGNYTLNQIEIGLLSVQKGSLASSRGNRVLNIGSGRVLETHDGLRLTGGYLFLPRLMDIVKRNYRHIQAETVRHLEKPGPMACFSNTKDWLAGALILYEMTDRGFSKTNSGVWTRPQGDKTVVLKELAKHEAVDRSCRGEDTLHLDFTPCRFVPELIRRAKRSPARGASPLPGGLWLLLKPDRLGRD